MGRKSTTTVNLKPVAVKDLNAPPNVKKSSDNVKIETVFLTGVKKVDVAVSKDNISKENLNMKSQESLKQHKSGAASAE